MQNNKRKEKFKRIGAIVKKKKRRKTSNKGRRKEK